MDWLDVGEGVEKEGHGYGGVQLEAVRMVNEVALLLREVPVEVGGARVAWIVDGEQAVRKASRI